MSKTTRDALGLLVFFAACWVFYALVLPWWWTR